MATNFRVKIGEIGCFIFILALAFPNGSQCRHSDFKKYIYDDLATLFVNLVDVVPVTLEFKNGKAKVYNRSSLSVK